MLKQKIQKLTVGVGLAVIAAYFAVAQAQTADIIEYSKTIARLGAQGTGWYVGFNESLTQNCQWGNVYIASNNPGLYVQLLAAKLSGRTISRLDYNQPGGSGSQCYATIVEIAS